MRSKLIDKLNARGVYRQDRCRHLTKRLMRTIGLMVLLSCSATVTATPQIQTWQTENGAKVLFVPAKE
ncbi:MAG: hypothetical protein KAT12_04890, partial [Gammaproteobacteria bacterium]|nr:hypothetical protein [Gammaproteobacteria bacterium]